MMIYYVPIVFFSFLFQCSLGSEQKQAFSEKELTHNDILNNFYKFREIHERMNSSFPWCYHKPQSEGSTETDKKDASNESAEKKNHNENKGFRRNTREIIVMKSIPGVDCNVFRNEKPRDPQKDYGYIIPVVREYVYTFAEKKDASVQTEEEDPTFGMRKLMDQFITNVFKRSDSINEKKKKKMEIEDEKKYEEVWEQIDAIYKKIADDLLYMKEKEEYRGESPLQTLLRLLDKFAEEEPFEEKKRRLSNSSDTTFEESNFNNLLHYIEEKIGSFTEDKTNASEENQNETNEEESSLILNEEEESNSSTDETDSISTENELEKTKSIRGAIVDK